MIVSDKGPRHVDVAALHKDRLWVKEPEYQVPGIMRIRLEMSSRQGHRLREFRPVRTVKVVHRVRRRLHPSRKVQQITEQAVHDSHADRRFVFKNTSIVNILSDHPLSILGWLLFSNRILGHSYSRSSLNASNKLSLNRRNKQMANQKTAKKGHLIQVATP